MTWWIFWIMLCAASPDQPEQVPLKDVSPWGDDWVVLDVGSGHVAAYIPEHAREGFFFGDKQQLWWIRARSYSAAEPERSFHVNGTDFRSPTRQTGLRVREGEHAVFCGQKEHPATPLDAAKAAQLMDRVTLHEGRWRRNMVAAYRDEYGVYYIIDRQTGEDEAVDHRVYIGWQGQVLRAPLRLLASDSLGRVYAGANGIRRLVITRDTVRYIEGEKERELHALDLVMDGPFLYTTLGLYGDAPHGTPCDLLLEKSEVP